MTSTSRAPTAAKPFKKPRKGHVLVMRTCTASLTSHKGFVWPESGDVEAPDWDPVASCGNGLHGLKWGVGGEVFHDGRRVDRATGTWLRSRGHVAYQGGRRTDLVRDRLHAREPAKHRSLEVNWGAASQEDRDTAHF